MNFNFEGYHLAFIQKEPCNDETDHLFTLVYKFFSPVTCYKYIVRAEYHCEDVFAIKFYAQQHSKSRFKYSKITNKGDLGNIIATCAKVLPYILEKYPVASFAFIGAPSLDEANTLEPFRNTQRYRTWCYVVASKIGTDVFDHRSYEEISGYLLLNKLHHDLNEKEQRIKQVFADTYADLLF